MVPMVAIVYNILLWSIALMGRLTVVRLKSPLMIFDPICEISDLKEPLNFEITALSVSAKPPSECPTSER